MCVTITNWNECMLKDRTCFIIKLTIIHLILSDVLKKFTKELLNYFRDYSFYDFVMFNECVAD